jgi:hypothetical protein
VSVITKQVELLLALQAHGVVEICIIEIRIHYVRVIEVRVEEIGMGEERAQVALPLVLEELPAATR